MANRFQRFVAYPLEAAALGLIFLGLKALPLDWASALGGAVARTIGPRLPVSDVARRNLRHALPELDPEPVVREVWDNLGRTFAEYPHLARLTADRVELVGTEFLDELRERQIFCMSGHFANWELLPATAARYQLELAYVYRAANNPWVDRLLAFARRANAGRLIPKGAKGARETVAVVKHGDSMGFLIDQKMNDGVPVTFFGRPAMTASAPIQLALKAGAPIMLTRIERLQGAYFRLTLEAPLPLATTGDRTADLQAGLALVTRRLEDWIRARPGQWLWLHRRWGKE